MTTIKATIQGRDPANPKFEYRNPKQYRNPKNTKNRNSVVLGFPLRISNLFRISDFGIRIYPLGVPRPHPPRVAFVELLVSSWPWLTAVGGFLLSLLVSLHIVFFKRDARAATAWLAVIWFAPFLGSLFYYLLGINRIQRRARRLRRKPRRPKPPADATGALPEARIPALPDAALHLAPLVQLSETVTEQPLCEGNTIEPLWDGDQAYPAMLQAIEEAKTLRLPEHVHH